MQFSRTLLALPAPAKHCSVISAMVPVAFVHCLVMRKVTALSRYIAFIIVPALQHMVRSEAQISAFRSKGAEVHANEAQVYII